VPFNKNKQNISNEMKKPTYPYEVHKILEAQDLIRIVLHTTNKKEVENALKKLDRGIYKILEMYFEVHGEVTHD
jgi:hypothetical protein